MLMNRTTKTKYLVLLTLISSLLVYLEWGGGNKMFLYQGEVELIKKMVTNPLSIVHPFILLPLIGQVLLILTLFLKGIRRRLIYLGILGIAILVVFVFFIGVLKMEVKILGSTIPFLLTAILLIREVRKE